MGIKIALISTSQLSFPGKKEERFGKTVHIVFSVFRMSTFSSSESDRYLDFVAFGEESSRMSEFCLKVMCVNVERQPYLLDLYSLLFLPRLFDFLCLCILELGIIHDPAHGRFGLRSYENKIEFLFLSYLKCIR